MKHLYWPDHVYHPTHGPQAWPWYRPLSWVVCRASLDPSSPRIGYHLWVYTRWGAIMFGLYWNKKTL